MSADVPDPGEEPILGLVIPADVDAPVYVTDLRESSRPVYQALQEHVGGMIEVVAFEEGDIWCNDEGRLINLPLNARACHWMLHDSSAGRHGRVHEGQLVYGDVVITGCPDSVGDATSVSSGLVERFESLTMSPEAMKDWDVRTINVTITTWQFGDDPGMGIDL